jgi:uncharacterized membrane protein (UPF0127 family)
MRYLRMALKDLTSKKVIAHRTVFCRSVFSQMRGLMFSPKDETRALIMEFGSEKIVPLHMMFVFYPIDILFVDSGKRVVELAPGAKPFISQIVPKHKARYVIELAAGKIRENRIKTGNRLQF